MHTHTHTHTHTHKYTIIIKQTQKPRLYKETNYHKLKIKKPERIKLKKQNQRGITHFKDEGRQKPTQRNADKTKMENTRKRSTSKWE
jgi:hypothetical protein